MNRNQIRLWHAEHPAGHPNRGAPYGERLDPVTIGVAVGGALLSSALSDKPSAPQAPAAAVAAPAVMPIPDDDAVKKAQRSALAGLQSRRGRQSTILSDNTQNDLLGA